MIPNRFSNFFAAVVAVVLLVGANLDAADLSRARVRDNIGYFLEPSSAQLKRYDMAAQAWLAPLAAPVGTTCFDIDTNAIFFGAGKWIIKTGLDGAASISVLELTSQLLDLGIAGTNLVFIQATPQSQNGLFVGIADKDKGILRDLRSLNTLSARLTVSQSYSTVFVTSQFLLQRFDISGGGMLVNPRQSGIYQAEPENPILVSSDGLRLFQGDSSVYSPSSLLYRGRLAENLMRIAFNGRSFIASSGSNLIGIARGGNETGRLPLSFAPGSLAVYSTNAFAFGGNPLTASAVPLSSIGASDPEASYSPAQMVFQPESIATAPDGVVHFVDKRFPTVFRWSAQTAGWMAAVDFDDLPQTVAVDGSADRLLAGAASGKVYTAPLIGLQPVTVFTSITNEVSDLVMAGNFVCVGSAASLRIWTVNGVGQAITNFFRDFGPGSLAWAPTNRLLWSRLPYGSLAQAVELTPFGRLAADPFYLWGGYSGQAKAPPVLSPAGNRLLAFAGDVFNVPDGSTVASLGIEQTAAVWTSSGLTTVRGFGGYANIQRWSESFQQTAGAFLEGSPLGVYEYSTNVVMVSKVGVELQFTVWSRDLALISASLVSAPPTNVVYSGSGFTNGTPTGATIGSFSLEPDLGGGIPSFSIRGQTPYADFVMFGTNLVFNGSRYWDPGTNVIRVVVEAVGQRGRSVVKEVLIPVVSVAGPGTPTYLLERISPSNDADPGHPARFRVRRTGDVSASVSATLVFGGDARRYRDFDSTLSGNYWDQSPPFLGTIYFNQGSSAAEFTITPYVSISPAEPKTLTLGFFSNGGNAGTNSDTLILWPSAYAGFFGSLYGAAANTNSAAGPDSDLNGDGVLNGAEFLFDFRPGTEKSKFWLDTNSGGQLQFNLRFRRPLPVEGDYDLLVSKDLKAWWPARFFETRGNSSEGRTETVTWTGSAAAGTNAFFRLRAASFGRMRLPDLWLSEDSVLKGVPQAWSQVGSDMYENGHDSGESPTFRVSFTQPFWMTAREVSQSEYVALMTNNPSVNVGTNLPVENVTWTEAAEFCRRLTEREATAGRLPDGYVFRLPTEAEWEYSARGGGYLSWGSIDRTNLTASAWFAPNSFYITHPVGRLAPNAYGLQDMLGNVAEWCADWYGPYPTGTVIDRVGPLFGTQRVIRGGNVLDSETGIRAAARSSAPPEFRSRLVGFRVVLARPVQ